MDMYTSLETARMFSRWGVLPVILVGRDSIVIQLIFSDKLANVSFLTTDGYYYEFQISTAIYLSR